MKNEFVVISDIHLENKKPIEKDFLLTSINELIKQKKEKNISLVVVCPGDVHNGTKGLEFLGKINAPVVYVAGNHEYWENDYDEVRHAIKTNLPNNVSFLDNDFVVFGEYIYVGATMWTDLAKDLNPDLFPHLAYTMNDTYKITYKTWYENPENIEKISSIYQNNHEVIIEKKLWNIYAQREENQKSLNYFQDFIEVFEVIEKIPEAFSSLEYALNSKSDFMRLSRENYLQKKENLESYKEDISFREWMEINKDTLNLRYNFSLNSSNENKEKIFNKLKLLDLKNMRLIMVSHHLPFLEERLIGRQEWFDEKINNNYFNDVPNSLYALRRGTDYNYHNYFWRVSKGEFSKDECIPQIVHYSNDGSENLSARLLEKVYAWVHGHEHTFNYEDSLKGIKMLTNPLAYSMAVFKFESDGKIKLSNTYRNYHQVTEKDEPNVLNNLKKSFLRTPNLSLSKNEMKDAVVLWALKHFKWEDYISTFEYTEELNNKLFDLLLNNSSWSSNLKDKNKRSVFMLLDSISTGIESLREMESRLNEGITLRVEMDYSFNKKYGKTLDLYDYSSYFKVISIPLLKLKHTPIYKGEYEYETWLKDSFINKKYMELNKEKILKTQEIFSNFNIARMNEINLKAINSLFRKIDNKDNYFDFELRKNIENELFKLRKQYQSSYLEEQRKRQEKLFNF